MKRICNHWEQSGEVRPFHKMAAVFIFALLWSAPYPAAGWTRSDSDALIREMKTAYEQVQDYRALLTITGFGSGPYRGPQKALYRFRKPNRIRVDFESPDSGMVIIYPDSDGKALLHPGKFFPFFVHLDPNSSLMEVSPGQHIYQTDLGTLIHNISQMLTGSSLGKPDVQTYADKTVVSVFSRNPFMEGVETRYVFTIDNRLHLPVQVEEFSPEGALRRRVVYEDLQVNTGIPESVFSAE
jgi:outer membrane lipoprotein-sorting protein